MKHFSFYDPATGELTGETFGTNDPDEAVVKLNVREDRPAVEGLHNHRTHRVDLATKQVVPLGAQPAPHAMAVLDSQIEELGRQVGP